MTQQAFTPFTQTSASTMLGLGAPIVQAYDTTVLAAAGPTTITLTFSGPVSKGRLRIKSNATNGATTIAIGTITMTDGVSTVLVKPSALPVTGAGQNFDVSFELVTDMNATSLSFAVTLAGATMATTILTEFFGNP